MSANPFDDNYQPEAEPVFEGPDEEVIPVEDQPAEHVNWMCTGVASNNLKRLASEAHMMVRGSLPDQHTTDAAGRFMQGPCPDCGGRTIWKKVTL